MTKSIERFDVYQHVTDAMIRHLDAGVLPWSKPWSDQGAPLAMPLRSTGEAYRGVNVLLLWMAAEEAGYMQRRWMTFKQAIEAGAGVRKGEKGAKVVYANKITREEERDGQVEEVKIPYMKAYTVFNVEQIEGLADEYYETPAVIDPATAPQRIAEADQFFASTRADIRSGGNRCFYSPAQDFVQMAPIEAFDDAENYYANLAHEVVHWTRHPSRLDRDFGAKRFGDAAYAREELVAEIGAAFLAVQLGLYVEPREDHAAYLAEWLKILGEDKRAIFQAASHAQKACDYLQGLATAEPVTLADGPALQALIPGVAAVPLARRQIAAHAARKASRRGCAGLPAGGLFDDTARAQQELF